MKLSLLSTILLAVTSVASQETPLEAKLPVHSLQHETLSERREWRTLDRSERKEFIDAVKCLGRLPHDPNITPSGATPNIPSMNTSASYYDDFVYVHIDSNVKDHFTALFLPWHRWFLHTFHMALKDKCAYNGVMPYWNWSLDVGNVTNSPVFDVDPESGFGTFGTSEDDQWAVKDGAFSTTQRAYPIPHTVSRKFNPHPFGNHVFPFGFKAPEMHATQPFAPETMEKIIEGSAGNFTDFAYKIDGVTAQGPHNAAHLMMGGDMGNLLWSPNDPLFYLHHTHLDCVWEKWQNRRPENAMAFGGGLTQDVENYHVYPVGAPPAANISSILPTEGLTSTFRVVDMMSTSKLGYTCV
ncbi:tyrosinase tyrosinase: common central domain protein [Rhizoctonia solani 123E]|uniref:Tyrosinase tyrosinase: common central domain protein n=1 Tax=Rhizoctonia solani 123E TaxID=1423351 RepID=A0A074RTB9_9AGAM|nr:tyrosinase tyrosinase: common central domain protein [Rhizoctonia solani 123E]